MSDAPRGDAPTGPQDPAGPEGPHRADAADGQQPGVGSVAEEATKLLGALAEWARDRAPDLGPDLQQAADGLVGVGGVEGLADRAAAAASEVSAHLDAGAPECSWCPVCRTVHLVRAASPEVRDHLVSAAASLAQAAAGFLAAAGAQPGTSAPGSPGAPDRSGVEHIDLDADPAPATPPVPEPAPDDVRPEERP